MNYNLKEEIEKLRKNVDMVKYADLRYKNRNDKLYRFAFDFDNVLEEDIVELFEDYNHQYACDICNVYIEILQNIQKNEFKEVKDYVITITNYFNNFKGEMTTSELENLIHIVANALDIDTDNFEITIIDYLTINDFIEDDKGEEVYIKIIDILNEVQRGVY